MRAVGDVTILKIERQVHQGQIIIEEKPQPIGIVISSNSFDPGTRVVFKPPAEMVEQCDDGSIVASREIIAVIEEEG
jgi:hypothetical protein